MQEDDLRGLSQSSPAEEGAFLGEPCRMVYSLFYVKICLFMSWTTQNHLLDLCQHWIWSQEILVFLALSFICMKIKEVLYSSPNNG